MKSVRVTYTKSKEREKELLLGKLFNKMKIPQWAPSTYYD